MTDRTRPKLSIDGPRAPLPAPRGRVMTAKSIVKEFYTDPITGEELVSEKWVRVTVPGKHRPSYNVVYWYYDDVVAWIEKTRVNGERAAS